jgi:MerR family copper efflux transcriptional regulator
VVMRDTLANLSRHCAGDKRPGCPILDGISGPAVRQGLNLKGKPATRSAAFAV